MTRILAIDPDPTILELLKDVLELEGYRIAAAHSLDESLEMLRQEQFDALLVDYRILHRWSHHPILAAQLEEIARSVPILCLSTAHMPGSSPPAGTRAMVTKPFEIAELIAALHQMMHGSAAG